jgi:hypothetical protein
VATVYRNDARLDCWPRCLPRNYDNRRSADPDTDLQPRDHSFDGSQRHRHLFGRELPAEYCGHLHEGREIPGQWSSDERRCGPGQLHIPDPGIWCFRAALGELTVSASGGGVEASTAIVVTPVPHPPLYCGPAGCCGGAATADGVKPRRSHRRYLHARVSTYAHGDPRRSFRIRGGLRVGTNTVIQPTHT